MMLNNNVPILCHNWVNCFSSYVGVLAMANYYINTDNIC